MTLMAGDLQHAFLLDLIVIEPRVPCFFRLHASLHLWILGEACWSGAGDSYRDDGGNGARRQYTVPVPAAGFPLPARWL
jgi:hypothetical protein